MVYCSVLSVFIRYLGHFIQHSSTETGTRRHFGRRRSFGVAGHHFSFLRVTAAYSSSASVRPAFVQFTSLRFSSLLVFYSPTFSHILHTFLIFSFLLRPRFAFALCLQADFELL